VRADHHPVAPGSTRTLFVSERSSEDRLEDHSEDIPKGILKIFRMVFGAVLGGPPQTPFMFPSAL